MFQPSRNLRQGFTLIELCIVLGIVAILSAILLVAVGRAREASKSVHCSSNLSQIGKGLFQYASRHRGFVPRASMDLTLLTDPLYTSASFYQSASSYPSFVRILQSSLNIGSDPIRQNDILHCPSQAIERIPTSYVINGVGIKSPQDFELPYVESPAGVTQLSAIKRASEIPYVLDGADYFDMGVLTGNLSMDSVFLVDAHFISCNAHLVGQFNQRIASSRHGRGRINVLYFDGSVRTAHSEEIDLHTLDDGIRRSSHFYGWQILIP